MTSEFSLVPMVAQTVRCITTNHTIEGVGQVDFKNRWEVKCEILRSELWTQIIQNNITHYVNGITHFTTQPAAAV